MLTKSIFKIAILAMAIYANKASAEWISVGKSSDGIEAFVNTSDFTKVNNYIIAWTLLNSSRAYTNEETGEKYHSTLLQKLYDCKQKKSGVIKLMVYTKLNGGGDLVYTSGSNPTDRVEFETLNPNSNLYKEMYFVCGFSEMIEWNK